MEDRTIGLVNFDAQNNGYLTEYRVYRNFFFFLQTGKKNISEYPTFDVVLTINYMEYYMFLIDSF